MNVHCPGCGLELRLMLESAVGRLEAVGEPAAGVAVAKKILGLIRAEVEGMEDAADSMDQPIPGELLDLGVRLTEIEARLPELLRTKS